MLITRGKLIGAHLLSCPKCLPRAPRIWLTTIAATCCMELRELRANLTLNIVSIHPSGPYKTYRIARYNQETSHQNIRALILWRMIRILLHLLRSAKILKALRTLARSMRLMCLKVTNQLRLKWNSIRKLKIFTNNTKSYKTNKLNLPTFLCKINSLTWFL